MENFERNINLEGIKDIAVDEDIDKVLKSSVGGYTKKSVMEHLETIKMQHQNSEDSLKLNIQTLFDEKEKLTQYCQKLQENIDKLENDNKVLGNRIAEEAVEKQDSKTVGPAAYKAMVKDLQQDVKELENNLYKSKIENNCLSDRCEQKEKEISQKDHEIELLSEIIAEAKKETEAEKEKLTELSYVVNKLKDENLYLKEIVSTGKVSELNMRIDQLASMVGAQNAIVEKRSQELETKDFTIKAVTAQNYMLNKTITTLTENIDTVMLQNEKLSAVNKIITQRLEAVQRAIVDEIAEKSDIYIEKLVLARRLDEARLKLNLKDEKNGRAKTEIEVLKFDEIPAE